MKKITMIIIATFSSVAMALVSCNKDIALQEIEQEPAGTISVSVDGIMGEYSQGNETKAGLVSTTRVSWSAGDKVYVYDGASCLGELTVSLKDGRDYYAVLTGEDIKAPQSGTTKLTLVYSNATVSAISNGTVTVDISSQVGNTTPNDIPFIAFGTLDYTSGTPEISGQIADFSLATSLMRLNCSGLKASAAISGAKLMGMSNECVLNITNDGVTIGEGNMGDIAVTFADVSANAKGTQTLYAAVAKNESASNQTLDIFQANIYTYSFGSKVRASGKAFNAICPMDVISISGEFTVNAEGRQIYFSKGNLYFDGSSFKFEDNQYDTHGYNAVNNTWGLFGWSTSSTNYGMSVSSTNIDYSGIFYDWGNTIEDTGCWRTLSKAEWQYLLDTPSRMVYGKPCYSKAITGITIEGQTYGGIFLYPDNYNGNVVSESMTWNDINSAGIVFLPVSGYRAASKVLGTPALGHYWTSSASDGNTAYTMTFSGDYVSYSTFERKYGCAVRLVMDPSPAPTFTVTFDLNGKAGVSPEGYKQVIYGTPIPRPSDPFADGFYFTGWYNDKDCTTLWDFDSDVVTTDITLYAGWSELPIGALRGKFSVSGDKQVYFSQGNLWYGKTSEGAESATFNFEVNQYDFRVIGGDEYGNVFRDDEHISHFMWSKNADVACALKYNDPSLSNNDVLFTNAAQDTANPDFTANGQKGMWRALSGDEWKYLVENNGSLWTTINGINGLIIFCDGYSGSKTGLTEIPKDCLFLPAAGVRNGIDGYTHISSAGVFGNYWSASLSYANHPFDLYFLSDKIYPGVEIHTTDTAQSVRLVTDVK